MTSKTRILRVTLDITLKALPRKDWEDDFDQGDGEEMSDDAPLEEATSDEVAACVDGAINDEMFAGSMLFLSVVETAVVAYKWNDEK